jgi:4'-phosphopantetheinyl transferase
MILRVVPFGVCDREDSDAHPAVPEHRGPFAREVVVRLVALDQRADVVGRLGRTLSEDERPRAARFIFPQDAVRVAVSRAVLRSIFGHTLGARPHALRFVCGVHGKPELAAPFDGTGLTLNLVHSSALAPVAMTRDARIGVDIEWRHPLADVLALIEQNFSPRERHALLTLPGGQREAAFFRYWQGGLRRGRRRRLGVSARQVQLSFRAEEAARLEEIEGKRGTALDSLGSRTGTRLRPAVVVDGRCARPAWSLWEEPAS